MKITIHYLFALLLCLLSGAAFAQGTFTLSGRVTNEKGEVQKAATVFISGTQKITATDTDGRFTFSGMNSGTYQVSVKMLGFAPYSQNVIMQGESADIKIALAIKPFELKEVVIGPDNWDANYAMFKDAFLGTTKNAKSCVIVNPKVLSFSYSKKRDVLSAEADDFLVIENKRLGYRIRYMLKLFDKKRSLINYDGETSFEELEGTDKMKKEWAENRAEAYTGSLMHFLRSIYANKAMQEGFMAHQLGRAFGSRAGTKVSIDPRPINFDTISVRLDSSLVALKFTSMYVYHNPKKTAKILAGEEPSKLNELVFTEDDSILKLYLNMATIDARGSYTDYRTFLKQGKWAMRLVGDQLPFEYQPPPPVK